MPLVQRFAQVFGIVYLLVGVLGFVLPLMTGPMPATWGPLLGILVWSVRRQLVTQPGASLDRGGGDSGLQEPLRL